MLLSDSFPLPLDRPFTSEQARRAGVNDHELRELTRARLLRSPIRRVYVAAQLEDSRFVRRQVLELAVPPGSVIVDWSACWYWTSIDRPNADLSDPALSVFRSRGHDRLRNGLVTSGQRWFRPDEIVPIAENLFVTTPLRTAWDLGRFFAPVIALGGMDALARLDDFSRDDLLGQVERFRKQRGVVQLRMLAPLVDPRAESPGESALRWRWLETPGMPKPELQIPVESETGEATYWVDLGLEDVRFGAEYFGEEFHDERTHDHDQSRIEELEEAHDWTLCVFRRRNVFGQQQDAGPTLLRGLLEARNSFGRFRGRRTTFSPVGRDRDKLF